MKIMISSDGPHAHYYIRMGWARVFNAMGHDVGVWDVHEVPAFDAFDEMEPDIFLGQTYNLDRALFTCIKERPHLKVVMRASDWGDMQKDIDKDKYPVLSAREDEIKWVEKLKEETGKPDFVHNHYTAKWMKVTHNKWKDIGVKPVSLIHAADVFDYANGEEKPEYKSDLSFVGGYWEHKAKSIDKYLIPLCKPVGKYNIKIFGNSDWPVVQYLGSINNDEVKHVFKSAKICPNISEPHSQDFGYDVIERPFKILMSQGFCISDYVKSMAEEIFPNDEIVFAKSPMDFKNKIEHYIKHPEKREKHITKGYNCVLDRHTYFHRVAKIFEELGMKNEKDNCLTLYKGMIK